MILMSVLCTYAEEEQEARHAIFLVVSLVVRAQNKAPEELFTRFFETFHDLYSSHHIQRRRGLSPFAVMTMVMRTVYDILIGLCLLFVDTLQY